MKSAAAGLALPQPASRRENKPAGLFHSRTMKLEILPQTPTGAGRADDKPQPHLSLTMGFKNQ